MLKVALSTIKQASKQASKHSTFKVKIVLLVKIYANIKKKQSCLAKGGGD
jgi:hypothetical protein